MIANVWEVLEGFWGTWLGWSGIVGPGLGRMAGYVLEFVWEKWDKTT